MTKKEKSGWGCVSVLAALLGVLAIPYILDATFTDYSWSAVGQHLFSMVVFLLITSAIVWLRGRRKHAPGNGTPDEENERRPGEPSHRIPLALVALVLYSGTLVHWLGTVLSDRTVDGLIGALTRLAIEAGMTTELVMGVVLYRRRRERRAA